MAGKIIVFLAMSSVKIFSFDLGLPYIPELKYLYIHLCLKIWINSFSLPPETTSSFLLEYFLQKKTKFSATLLFSKLLNICDWKLFNNWFLSSSFKPILSIVFKRLKLNIQNYS